MHGQIGPGTNDCQVGQPLGNRTRSQLEASENNTSLLARLGPLGFDVEGNLSGFTKRFPDATILHSRAF